jgi:hypothetical protein
MRDQMLAAFVGISLLMKFYLFFGDYRGVALST